MIALIILFCNLTTLKILFFLNYNSIVLLSNSGAESMLWNTYHWTLSYWPHFPLPWVRDWPTLLNKATISGIFCMSLLSTASLSHCFASVLLCKLSNLFPSLRANLLSSCPPWNSHSDCFSWLWFWKHITHCPPYFYPSPSLLLHCTRGRESNHH